MKARSPVFRAMLDSPMNCGRPEDGVRIEDVEPEGFKQLLYFIYTGEAPHMLVNDK